MPAVSFRALADATPGESSAAVGLRVREARERQRCRYAALDGSGFARVNGRAPMRVLKQTLGLDAVAERILEGSMERLRLSARGHDRILRVARTIADLEGSDRVRSVHVAETVQYRCLDRPVEPLTMEAPRSG